MERARRAPVLVATLGAAYLAATAGRDLAPFDSAELALNAVQLGVGYPPGQPLYLALSAAMVRALPFVSPSLALVLLSIGATAGAAALAVRVALGFAGPMRVVPDAEGLAGGAGRRDRAAIWASAGPAGGVGAALLLPGVWDLGTRAEVYPLAALLVLAAAALLLPTPAPSAAKRPRLALAGLLLGLAASVNPAMALVGALALAPAAIARAASAGPREGLLGLGALVAAGLAGLAPYGLLPLLGAHPRGALVWGEPLSGPSLRFFLAGRDYRAWHIGAAELSANGRAALAWLVTEGLLSPLLLGALGLLAAPGARLAALALLGGAGASLGLLCLNHPFIASNPDYHGYLLPWVWLAAAGCGVLLARLVASSPRGRWLAPLALLTLIAGGALAGSPLWRRDRSRPPATPGSSSRPSTTRLLAERALAEAPPRAVLVLESDHLVFAALYLQQVEGVRPDLTLLNLGWANSSWYWRWLLRRDPTLPAPRLEAPSREARVAAFLAEAQRPVSAERLHLAALAGPPCMGALLAHAGAPCARQAAVLGPAEQPTTPPAPGRAPAPPARVDGRDAMGVVQAAFAGAAGDLDRRVAATAVLHLVDDRLRAGGSGRDLDAALRLLDAGLRGARLPGPPLPPVPPELASAAPPLTRLVEPRALLPPGVLALRAGDLTALFDSRLAAEYYRIADLPEADDALARLAGPPASRSSTGTSGRRDDRGRREVAP